MLSKSDILSLLQCPRKLWLEHHKPELLVAHEDQGGRRVREGNAVGKMARERLGTAVLWPPSRTDRAEAANIAQAMLSAQPDLPGVEVPMVHQQLYVRADALIPEANGYVLQETKASSFPLKSDKLTPGAAKDQHLDDIAIQAWVMQGSSMPMRRAELNLLNNRWRYPGGSDYSGMFRQLDVSTEVQNRVAQVPDWLAHATSVLNDAMPVVTTGRQCTDPGDCPFQDHCQRRDPPRPDHPIELLPDSAGKRLAQKLRESKGYTSLLDPRPEEFTGAQAALYRRMQHSHRTGHAVLEPASVGVLTSLPYPRYFFDFEGIDFAVPRWVGMRPYEQVCFQWSCHIERSAGVFEHAEFLDLTGEDPTLGCIEHLRKVINPDDNGPIFVYHATYEKGRLQEMAERHPEHASLLLGYIQRIVDLLPIVRDHFYHPQMRGSFSIKRVLPHVAPDLDYGQLDEVQEGTGAQDAYVEAGCQPVCAPQRKADLDGKLRTYCRQDTWAMVEVAYFLSRAGRPVRPAGM